MENIVIIITILITIILLKIIFKISIKKAREIQENKELEKITDRFPENMDIAREILKNLNNEKVKIEEAKNTNTSLYIAITDKIIIADLKNNYARIQTIAHECAHSVQDRRILLANFVISNICMIYYVIIFVLTILKIINNPILQMVIFMLLICIKLVIRTYLETEAMTKSRYIAEQYINKKNICKENERDKLLIEYDKINKMGIPFMIDNLMTSRVNGNFIVCNNDIFYCINNKVLI